MRRSSGTVGASTPFAARPARWSFPSQCTPYEVPLPFPTELLKARGPFCLTQSNVDVNTALLWPPRFSLFACLVADLFSPNKAAPFGDLLSLTTHALFSLSLSLSLPKAPRYPVSAGPPQESQVAVVGFAFVWPLTSCNPPKPLPWCAPLAASPPCLPCTTSTPSPLSALLLPTILPLSQDTSQERTGPSTAPVHTILSLLRASRFLFLLPRPSTRLP